VITIRITRLEDRALRIRIRVTDREEKFTDDQRESLLYRHKIQSFPMVAIVLATTHCAFWGVFALALIPSAGHLWSIR
jgi:hypothetical protein